MAGFSLFKRLFVAAIAGTLLVSSPTAIFAGKHPEPSVYPLPNAWYLGVKAGMLKRIVVAVPGQKAPNAYWYLPYTVTNNTGKEINFFPEFEMVTQDGKIHRSDNHVPLAVFQAVKKDNGNDLLVSANDVIGILHQGDDQAKDCVAIWEEPMPRMGTFAVYGAGFSSESVYAVDDKGEKIKDGQGNLILLRKTLALDYVIFGDEIAPDKDIVHLKKESWIMR